MQIRPLSEEFQDVTATPADQAILQGAKGNPLHIPCCWQCKHIFHLPRPQRQMCHQKARIWIGGTIFPTLQRQVLQTVCSTCLSQCRGSPCCPLCQRKKSPNRVRRQSGFPTFISCQRQDANVLPERRQSHQGDKLCEVSTVPLVARWPVFLARGSDADGEPHSLSSCLK